MSSNSGWRGPPTFVKVFIGVMSGSVAVGIVYVIIKTIYDKLKPKARAVDEESTKDDVVLGRLLRYVANYEARNQEHVVKPINSAGTHDVVTYNHEERQTIELFIDDILKEKPLRFSSNELVALTHNYSTKLGSGGFGEVYKGNLGNGVMLAVKVLKSGSIDNRVVKELFMAEVGTIGRTYHTNLVRLYGFCFDVETKALVYEYMENGSLDKFLFGKKCGFDRGKLWEIVIGVAKGLEYLHHYGHKRIIHYDIKPENVLLDLDFSPKLADFGLAKLCNRDSTHITLSRGRGTPGYAAPELWMPFLVTYKCDVYSFGMMLFEIVGMRKNLDINLTNSTQEWFPRQLWNKHEKGELEIALEDRGIEEDDMIRAKTMTMVALWCIQYLPDDRPSMSSVVKILEGEAQVTLPPNPFRHSMSSGEKLDSCTESSSFTTANDITIDTKNDCTPIMKKYEIAYADSS